MTTQLAAKPRYIVRVAGPSDYVHVITLWREGMSAVRVREFLEQRRAWFYERNPSGHPVTWLAVDTTTSEVVGCASIFPRRLRFDGKLLTAGIMSDFVVSPRHRIAGPALIMQRALVEQSHEHGFALIYGYPNDKALPIFERIGVRIVGNATSWHKPLRLRGDLAKVVGSRLPSRVPSLVRAPLINISSRIGAMLGDPFLPLFDWARGRRVPRCSRWSIQTKTSSVHDSIADLLAPNTRISRVLERPYLDWRYGEFTTNSPKLFTLLTEGQTCPIGIVAFRENGDRVFVLDAAWRDEPGAAHSLFVAFFRSMRAIGASIVLVDCYVGHESVQNLLHELGFLKRPLSRSLIAHASPQVPAALRTAMFQESSWALFSGELDI